MNNQSLWVDGYVFYQKRSSWINVCRLWQQEIIRFAVKNETGDDAIVAFVGEGPGDHAHADRDAKMLLAERAANPSFTSAKSTLITINGPSRWSPKQRYAAHVRIWAVEGKAEAVYDALDPRRPNPPFQRGQGYNGHAMCEGGWDILLELGADSADDLAGLVARARALENVASTKVTTCLMPASLPKAPDTCEEWT